MQINKFGDIFADDEKKILVFGDCILDKYFNGVVSKFTPDAPVPVIKVREDVSQLGGAGNILNNLVGLGAQPFFITCAGDDFNGKLVEELIQQKCLNYYLQKNNNPTTTKITVVGERQEGEKQKVARLDFEETLQLSPCDTSTLKRILAEQIPSADCVIVSDYGKGLCTPELVAYIINIANNEGIPVGVDPKGRDWDKYKKATFVKPNIDELNEILETRIKNTDEDILKVSHAVRDKFDLENLVVTRGDKGIICTSSNGAVLNLPADTDNAINVIGAGDCIISTISYLISNQCEMFEAVEIANMAAGIIVSQYGTTAINKELLNSKMMSFEEQKVVPIQELENLISRLRARERKVVFTNGYFDRITNKHIDFLKLAEKKGDVLLVGLNNDSKEIDLEHNVHERLTVLSQLEIIDYIIIFDSKDPINILKTIRPDVIVKGGNYSMEQIIGREYARKSEIISLV